MEEGKVTISIGGDRVELTKSGLKQLKEMEQHGTIELAEAVRPDGDAGRIITDLRKEGAEMGLPRSLVMNHPVMTKAPEAYESLEICHSALSIMQNGMLILSNGLAELEVAWDCSRHDPHMCFRCLETVNMYSLHMQTCLSLAVIRWQAALRTSSSEYARSSHLGLTRDDYPSEWRKLFGYFERMRNERLAHIHEGQGLINRENPFHVFDNLYKAWSDDWRNFEELLVESIMICMERINQVCQENGLHPRWNIDFIKEFGSFGLRKEGPSLMNAEDDAGDLIDLCRGAIQRSTYSWLMIGHLQGEHKQLFGEEEHGGGTC